VISSGGKKNRWLVPSNYQYVLRWTFSLLCSSRGYMVDSVSYSQCLIVDVSLFLRTMRTRRWRWRLPCLSTKQITTDDRYYISFALYLSGRFYVPALCVRATFALCCMHNLLLPLFMNCHYYLYYGVRSW